MCTWTKTGWYREGGFRVALSPAKWSPSPVFGPGAIRKC